MGSLRDGDDDVEPFDREGRFVRLDELVLPAIEALPGGVEVPLSKVRGRSSVGW